MLVCLHQPICVVLVLLLVLLVSQLLCILSTEGNPAMACINCKGMF